MWCAITFYPVLTLVYCAEKVPEKEPDKEPEQEPAMICDFDNDDWCGWKQDQTDQADWLQHKLSTPSRSVGTGPQYDHTFGEGFSG